MKQGQATRDGAAGQKREPISTAIRPAYAGEIGIKRVSDSLKAPMREGPGYSAPAPTACSTHRSGSQGKHK